MYCLFECNHKLLTRNYTQYMESISKEGIPSGGGFSINRFNLDCLYSEHEKARNVWTRGNKAVDILKNFVSFCIVGWFKEFTHL